MAADGADDAGRQPSGDAGRAARPDLRHGDGRRPRTAGSGKDDRALADGLRGRKQEETAFLLAVDQFEELFTFANSAERERLDRPLAVALGDADCPLFMISTVHADFLDRLEELPRLVAARNRIGRPWTLPPSRGTVCARSAPARPGSPADGRQVNLIHETLIPAKFA